MRHWKSFVAALAIFGLASVWARADYPIPTPASGPTSIVFAFTCFTVKVCPTHVLVDSTGTEKGTAANPVVGTPIPGPQGSCLPYHLANGSAATNNATILVGNAATLCDLVVSNPGMTQAYLKIYDSAVTPTCSSATGLKHVYPISFVGWANGGSIMRALPFGEQYVSGIAFCITGAGTDTDNSAGPTGVYVEASYR